MFPCSLTHSQVPHVMIALAKQLIRVSGLHSDCVTLGGSWWFLEWTTDLVLLLSLTSSVLFKVIMIKVMMVIRW